jgi:CubicO group peptidase (beta-lactamase class C family)
MSLTAPERMARVIRDLQPETAFDGRTGPARTLAQGMAGCYTPGASIAVVEDFELAWAAGFGLCRAGGKKAVTPATPFQAASLSKPVFALAVMRLAQEGVLDLDRDVNDYLTSWRVPANEGWQPCVTLRHLLSHCAGLTVDGFPGYAPGEPAPALVQVLEGRPPANTPPVRANVLPGLSYRYSGGGTSVAQQAVVDCLGRPFPQLMRELVLEPLGMADSSFEQPPPPAMAGRCATGHPWKGRPLQGGHHVYPETAAAGLWTTAGDLARAGLEVLRALDGRPGTLLRGEWARAMLQPQTPPLAEGFCPALGFFLRGEGPALRFYHTGWNEGFVSLAVFYPQAGQGAVVMLNSNEGNDLMFEIARATGREYGWPGAVPEKRRHVEVAEPQRYAGLYAAETGIPLRVSAKDGAILLQAGRQPALRLDATAELEFLAREVNTAVSFQQDEEGAIVGLTLLQDGQLVRARPVQPPGADPEPGPLLDAASF